MKNKAFFADRIEGSTFIEAGRDRYFKTKDSASPSGHSLVAQIEMTHSGIVTKNYGFYLPWKMRDGAKSFTNDFAKPVIVGHDEDPFKPAEPVGRVIQADYFDTSGAFSQKDRHLESMLKFLDNQKGKKLSKDLELVDYVIKQYSGRDSYRGLGHIRGTFKITDEQTIAKILDERYLTVSTSMASDSARCSVCGTDWVSDGPCEHSRGGIYDDKVMVLVPGSMTYDHVGIVNNPADPHAAGFKIVNDYKIKDNVDDTIQIYQHQDKFSVAANLFAWNDKNLFSLSSKDEVDLIEVKDNIQKMEKAMAKKTKDKGLREQILDGVRVSTTVYSWGEGSENKEMSISQYAETLSEIDMEKLISDIATVMEQSDSVEKNISIEDAIKKHFEDSMAYKKTETVEPPMPTAKKKKAKNKKVKKMDSYKLVEIEEISSEAIEAKMSEVKDSLNALLPKWQEDKKDITITDEQVEALAEIAALIEAQDVITILHFGDSFCAEKALEKINQLDSAKDLATISEEEFVDMLNAHMPEDKKHSNEGLKNSDFCGTKGFFPVLDKNTYLASRAVLSEVKASDSVKGRVLGAMDKRFTKLGLTLEDSFDSNDKPCDNSQVAIEELVKLYEDAKQKLVDAGYQFEESAVVQDSSKDQEIAILEAQLEAANEEIDTLFAELVDVKDSLSTEMATRLVDLKILSNSFDIADRKKAIDEHKTRSLESLKDSIKDVSAQVDITKLSINDGVSKNDVLEQKIVNPVLEPETKQVSKQSKKSEPGFNKDKIYDQYNYYARVYGKVKADQWLDKVQKMNGLKPSLD
jgi:hypothetical protein